MRKADMDDFTDNEIKAMSQLHKDMAELMVEAIKDGMLEEHAIHVAGNVALLGMEKMPHTDDGAAVVQNFVIQVGDLLGDPETAVRH